jgi:cell wall assembly regulator SMI1
LDAAEAELGRSLPEHLRDLYRAGDGRFDRGGEWWVIWPLARAVADSLAAWRRGALVEDLLAFGDDGTGNPFCMRLGGGDEVVRWNWIDGTVENSEGALPQFLDRWAPVAG